MTPIQQSVRFNLQFTHCRQEQVTKSLHWNDDSTRPL